jgi:intracellular sulfur oxidation DsrE/DsrF family protein
MSDISRLGLSRRTALRAAGAAVAVAAVSQLPRVARAHDLRPNDPAYAFDEYESIVNRDVTIRQVYEWPNINNATIYNNISNGLNGFQFSYDLPSERVQVVVQAFASATLAMYDDAVWAKYRLGEVFKIQDPGTGQPATRNLWFASKNPPVSQPPPDRANPYYSDISIQGLQRRGVLFLICHQSIHAHGGQLASSEQNSDQQTAAEIVAEIQAHLIPGGLLVPAGVGELVRLQDKGFRLVVNA